MYRLVMVVSLAALFLGGGCDSGQTCVAGVTVSCTCPGGGQGRQMCLDDGSGFGACSLCWSPGDGGTGADLPVVDGTTVPPPEAGGDMPGTDGPSSPTGATLHATTEKIVAIFATTKGVIVVTTATLLLLDRKGKALKTITSPREIQTAALSSKYLAVGDKAMVVVYTPELAKVRQFSVKQTCVASVIVSKERYVCGPSNDWDRVFDVYDLDKGVHLATSKKYTYNGIPMRRLPGQDYFITVSGGSPSDFHLYRVNSSSDVPEFVGESPYHGAFAVSTTYAFDAKAVHLVNQTGLLLKVIGKDCSNSFTSDCFIKDGVLGTLSSKQSFLAMSDDQKGKIYGLVGDGSGWYPDCQKGCEVQAIDVANHTIVSKKKHTLAIQKVIDAKHDPVAGTLLVAYEEKNAKGYRVDSLAY